MINKRQARSGLAFFLKVVAASPVSGKQRDGYAKRYSVHEHAASPGSPGDTATTAERSYQNNL